MLAPVDDIGVRFLKLILPEQGYYVATIKRVRSKGFKASIFASTIEELWATIQTYDRDGFETYHACASFKEARNDPPGTPDGQKLLGRTKHNALGAKAFWLDLDVGPDKLYKNLNQALDALAAFCRTLKLPTTIIISSGSGLHVYWPLHMMLNRPTWEHYASGLKNLCNLYQLHADPARTADISSVMRTPGTHNRKRTPHRLVECSSQFLEIQPYAIEQFEVFLVNADTRQRAEPAFQLGTVSARLLPKPSRSIVEDALAGLAVHPSAFGAEIVKHCGQLQKLRDTGGNLSEPEWYADLGVLAFCEDGEQLAHEWSSSDERYTREETQARLERARSLTGATTCAHFHSLNPAICERCKQWPKLTSPIKLGRDPTVSTAAGTQATTTLTPRWEYTRGNALKPRSYVNASIGLGQLGIKFRHDIFHNKKIVEGDVVENLGRELSDSICRALRDTIIAKFGVDPGIENVQQAAERACEATRVDPVLDYLDSLQWDGKLRLDRWLETYLGAEDTPLNRTIGRKMLIAAVRRARRPGCKFDYVVVLEGKQGSGKSTALRILAGDDNFSDQPILHLDTRAQQEATEGVLIYELSELAGLRRTEIETIKGFLSKTEDNVRPAYGRFRIDQARRFIFVGTTNDNEYLRDATGNRRFWPVSTGRIDLGALQADRDQLWAEAAKAEAQGEPLAIPEHLYGAASVEQDQRLIKDPWDDILAGVSGTKTRSGDGGEEERISSTQLIGGILQLSADRQTDVQAKRLRTVMHRLGWRGPKKMRIGHGDKPVMGYWRTVPPQACSE